MAQRGQPGGGSRGGSRSRSRSKRRSQAPAPEADVVAEPTTTTTTADQPQQTQPPADYHNAFEVYIQRPFEHVSSFFNHTAATLTATANSNSPTSCCNKPGETVISGSTVKKGKRGSCTKTISSDGGSDEDDASMSRSSTGCSLPDDYSAKQDDDDDLEDGGGGGGGHRSGDTDDDDDDDAFFPPPPMGIVDPIGQKNLRIRRLRRQRCILLLFIVMLGVLALILSAFLGRSSKRQKSSSSASPIASTSKTAGGGGGSSNNNSSQPVPNTTTTGGGVTAPSSSSSTGPWPPPPPPSEAYPDEVPYYPAPVPAVPAPSPTTTTSTTTNGEHCGCSACTDDVWNADADSNTCGERISWLHESFPKQYMTVQDACRRIAFEFPSVCARCDPARCNWIPETPFVIPEGDAWTGPDVDVVSQLSTEVSNPATLPDLRSYSLYCFPDMDSRTEYEMWNGMKVQVKRDPAGTPCGPGDNVFSESTVAVDTNTNELTLKYINGQAAEVRILLPENRRPYTYGNYAFSVKSISVKNADGQVIATQLPQELVLGMFTWDDTEDYASHQNYNHEVDIEISRWNHASNADVQFLVQPPGAPQQYRFFSGQAVGSSTDDMEMQLDYSSPNWYNFTWLPGRIDWSSTAGSASVDGELHDYTLTTEEALYKGVPDYVQCMPGSQNVEVRINLWNMLGAVHPAGLATTDVVEVVFDQIAFEPASTEQQLYLADGEFCSKTCQCSASSRCVNARCTTAA
jgi:hypothetical protein